MKKREYFIIKNDYRNEYGEITATNFSVKYKVYFLGIPFWRSVKEKVCGYDGVYTVPLTFKSEEDARSFITEKLCTKVQREGWERQIVGKVNCSN